MKKYDVIVVGLGITGAAALWQLSRSSTRVLGIEAGGPCHELGSSHGATRIFRRAYWEGIKYLPLLNLAHQEWLYLQSICNQDLINPCGGVFIGSKQTEIVRGCLNTASEGNIIHEYWDSHELSRRLPQFRKNHKFHAVYEPGAYAIAAENARLQMLNKAVENGASILYGEQVKALNDAREGMKLRTAKGLELYCSRILIATGPWLTRQFVPEIAEFLQTKRVPIFWFEPKQGKESEFNANRFPVFLYECEDLSLLYGIPAHAHYESGVKIGFHNRQQFKSMPGTPIPPMKDSLLEEISSYVTTIFPNLDPKPKRYKWCFYTISADESFVIGASKQYKAVWYASVCSGHGFKFASGIGHILSSLLRGEEPIVDINSFDGNRFSEKNKFVN